MFAAASENMRRKFCLARAAALPKSQSIVGRQSSLRRSARCLGACLLALLAGGAEGASGGQGGQPIYSLDDCLDIAARQNPDVLAEAKRVDAAKGTLTQARAGVFPSLTSSAYYQRLEQDVATNGGAFPNYQPNDYTADVRLSQNLYSAGSVRAKIAIAQMQLRAEELNYQAALQTAALAVRTDFYQALYSAGLIRVRQQAIDLLKAQVKDQQDRLTAGSVAQINVNRAQVSLVNEEPLLEEARYDLRAAYVQLSQVLAIPFPDSAPEVPFRLRGELTYEPMKLSLEECLRQADTTRPEIASKKLAIDGLRRQITVEKAATRPQISGFVSYDLYSEQEVNAVNSSFSGYTIGVQGNWLIFDGFLTRGKVRTVQAQIGEAEADLVSTRLGVEGDVRTAFYQLQQAEATLRPQADNIRLANENLDLTTKNFDTGGASQLEVLQSRVDLTRTQLVELASRQVYNTAIAKLLRAVGVSHLEKSAGTILPASGKQGK
jgi:outer membrane protein